MIRATFLELYDLATARALEVANAIPEEIWNVSPSGFMGPGEIIIHLIQAGKFNCALMRHHMDSPKEMFGLPAVYLPTVNSRHALHQFNVESARKSLSNFQTLEQLRLSFVSHRVKVRGVLASIPRVMENAEVTHPLVRLRTKTMFDVCAELFVDYTTICAGQVTQLMNERGFNYRFPISF